MSDNPPSSQNHAGHRERLRARLDFEPLSLADYEVLELFLGLSLRRKDTKSLAKELLKRFGSLRGCLDATPGELTLVPGFGPALLSLWKLLREIMARYSAGPLIQRAALANPQAVAEMAHARLASLPHEESWLALVNTQNLLLSWERLASGSIDFISIQPREIVETALLRKASGVILVHNHPGGNPRPSRADVELTAKIKELLPQLGLRLIDHLIVSVSGCYSFEQGTIISSVRGHNVG